MLFTRCSGNQGLFFSRDKDQELVTSWYENCNGLLILSRDTFLENVTSCAMTPFLDFQFFRIFEAKIALSSKKKKKMKTFHNLHLEVSIFVGLR